jgi:hypothetical protein
MGTDGRMEPQGHFGPFFSSSFIQFNFWLKKTEKHGVCSTIQRGSNGGGFIFKKGVRYANPKK